MSRTSVSLWKIIFMALFTYALNIWYEDNMTNELNAALFLPLLLTLAGPHHDTLRPSHTQILIAELALIPIEQLYVRSRLAHEARLRVKPNHNPAARLHAALNSLPYEHDSVAYIREHMELLNLKPIHMMSEYWTDFLTTQLTAQAKQNAHANPSRSHNIDKSRQLHEHGGYHNRKPFYRRFLNAKHVLKLRLQMAPLATHMYDDASALCQRCYQAPDTTRHWLWTCNALTTPRLILLDRIATWAALFDQAINSRGHSSAIGRWNSYSTTTQDLALQGTITKELQATLDANPIPITDPDDENAPTYTRDDTLIAKLVYILETYAKLTNRTCSLALYRSNRETPFSGKCNKPHFGRIFLYLFFCPLQCVSRTHNHGCLVV